MKWLRTAVVALALAGVVSNASAFVRGGASFPVTAFGWKQFLIGAGGLVSGFSIATDGTMVNRTDAFGGYYWNPSATTPQGNSGGTGAWQQYVTSSSMPSTQVNIDAVGVFEIAIAPSNTSTWYLVYHGYILKTTNKGQTWTQTASSGITIPITADANDQNTRTNGQKMAVDPADPNTVYLGTPSIGLLVTHDGGATWTTVSGVTSPNSLGFTGIIFDPTSGTNGSGYTNIVYAHSNGNGTYHTTNGSTWALISGSPTAGEFGAIDANGKYYLVSNGADLWQYASGTDTKKTTISGIHSVAVKPSDPTFVVVVDFFGNTWFSTNTAGSFTQSNTGWSVNDTQIPWLSISTFLTTSGAQFDPSVSNRLHFNTGIGMFYADLPANMVTTPLVWADRSVGIEELVTNEIVSSPACTGPTLFSWDRAAFYKGGSIYSIYPSTYGPHASFLAGWAGDYASSSPSTIVGLMNWTGDNSGISTDCGQTWTDFGSNTPFGGGNNGGSIAAASPTNIIWAPPQVQPYYTTDGGTTWNLLPVSGITDWSQFFPGAKGTVATPFAADRVSPDTFYLYMDTGASTGQNGVYRTQNKGASWTKMKSTLPITASPTGDYHMRASPDVAGKLYYTGGRNGNNLLIEDTNQHFIKSTNGGATWVDIAGGSPTVNTVINFGFGKGITAGVSAICVVGFVNHVYGVFRSYDDGLTWTQLGTTYPSGLFEEPRTLSCDMGTLGRAYWGGGGSGYQYGQFNFLLKRDIDPAANDNDPMWLEKAA